MGLQGEREGGGGIVHLEGWTCLGGGPVPFAVWHPRDLRCRSQQMLWGGQWGEKKSARGGPGAETQVDETSTTVTARSVMNPWENADARRQSRSTLACIRAVGKYPVDGGPTVVGRVEGKGVPGGGLRRGKLIRGSPRYEHLVPTLPTYLGTYLR